MPQVIQVHVEAPPKPGVGQACNGCGLCCLAEPCPVGMLLSRKRHGACVALRWVPGEQRYRCGLMVTSTEASAAGTWVPWLRRWGRRAGRAWAARLIAAGQGCDAWLAAQPEPSGPPGHPEHTT